LGEGEQPEPSSEAAAAIVGDTNTQLVQVCRGDSV